MLSGWDGGRGDGCMGMGGPNHVFVGGVPDFGGGIEVRSPTGDNAKAFPILMFLGRDLARQVTQVGRSFFSVRSSFPFRETLCGGLLRVRKW
jgi:hypothetical protein